MGVSAINYRLTEGYRARTRLGTLVILALVTSGLSSPHNWNKTEMKQFYSSQNRTLKQLWNVLAVSENHSLYPMFPREAINSWYRVCFAKPANETFHGRISVSFWAEIKLFYFSLISSVGTALPTNWLTVAADRNRLQRVRNEKRWSRENSMLLWCSLLLGSAANIHKQLQWSTSAKKLVFFCL